MTTPRTAVLGRNLLWHTESRVIARRARCHQQHQTRPKSTNSHTPGSSPKSASDTTPPALNKPQAPQQHQQQNVKPPLWQRLGPVTRAGAAVERMRARRPLTAQVIMTTAVFGIGDIVAQHIDGDGADFELARTGKALVIAPGSSIITYQWMMFISQRLNLASRALSVALRIAFTQAFFAPVICSYFFGMQALLAGEGPAGTWLRLRRALPPAWKNGLVFWPFVQAISFTTVPLHYRGLFNNVAGLFWQTYMAYLNKVTEDVKRVAIGVRATGSTAL